MIGKVSVMSNRLRSFLIVVMSIVVVMAALPMNALRVNAGSYILIYDANYDTLKDSMIDNVHTEDICSSVINALPLDSDKFIQVKYIDSVGYEPKFESEVDSLEKAADSDFGNIITFVVITSEDLSSYKEDDFKDIPELQTIMNSKNMSGTIKIVSIKDKRKASSLTGKIRDLNFSYDTHPMVYDSSGNKDAFDVYGIRNAISIKLNPGNLVYNYMD